jgi:hypothetical protein
VDWGEYWGGDLTFGGGGWTTSNGEHAFITFSPFTGAGGYSPFWALTGFGTTYQYALANAVAVDPTSPAAGSWGSSPAGISIAVGPDGSYTGTLSNGRAGTCGISGSIQPYDATSPRKNFLRMTLDAVASSECRLPGVRLGGYAAIEFVDAGTSTVPEYKNALVFIVRAPGQAYVSGTALRQ